MLASTHGVAVRNGVAHCDGGADVGLSYRLSFRFPPTAGPGRLNSAAGKYSLVEAPYPSSGSFDLLFLSASYAKAQPNRLLVWCMERSTIRDACPKVLKTYIFRMIRDAL